MVQQGYTVGSKENAQGKYNNRSLAGHSEAHGRKCMELYTCLSGINREDEY